MTGGYYHICPYITSVSSLSTHAGILWGQKDEAFGSFCSAIYFNNSNQLELSGHSTNVYSVSSDNLLTIQSPSGTSLILRADDGEALSARPEMTLFGDLSVTGVIWGVENYYVSSGQVSADFNPSADTFSQTLSLLRAGFDEDYEDKDLTILLPTLSTGNGLIGNFTESVNPTAIPHTFTISHSGTSTIGPSSVGLSGGAQAVNCITFDEFGHIVGVSTTSLVTATNTDDFVSSVSFNNGILTTQRYCGCTLTTNLTSDLNNIYYPQGAFGTVYSCDSTSSVTEASIDLPTGDAVFNFVSTVTASLPESNNYYVTGGTLTGSNTCLGLRRNDDVQVDINLSGYNYTCLCNIPSTFTPAAHTHTLNCITDVTATASEVNLLDGAVLGSTYQSVYVNNGTFSSTNLVTLNTGNNHVGINTSSPQSILHVNSNDASDSVCFVNNADSATGIELRGLKNRNNCKLLPSDSIFSIDGYGYDATSYRIGGKIDFVVDSTVTSNSVPTSLVFSTGCNSSTLTERIKIKPDGKIIFNQAYCFPTTDGTANQVIKTDGAGQLGFTTLGSAAYQSCDTFLKVANNLCDLTNVSTARTNLGLGSIATCSTTNFDKYGYWTLSASDTAGAYQVGSSCNITIDGGTNIEVCRNNNIISIANTYNHPTGASFNFSGTGGNVVNCIVTDICRHITQVSGINLDSRYQPLDADLTTIAGLACSDNNFIVGNGTAWTVESGETARTSLGLITATSSLSGLVKLGSDTIQTVNAGSPTTESDRTYAVQTNASKQLVVNVPWVDTNTTYTVELTTGQTGAKVQLNPSTGTGTFFDIIGTNDTTVTWNGTTITIDTDVDLSGYQSSLTFGIANTNAVSIDSTTVAENDYAKFTATGLEGRSYAEVRQDLGLGTIYNCAATAFDKYTSWCFTGGTHTEEITSGETLTFEGTSGININYCTSTGKFIFGGPDLTSYCQNHNHDDIYYTEAEIQSITATATGYGLSANGRAFGVDTSVLDARYIDNTNTTYCIAAVDVTGTSSAKIRLSGSDLSTDDITFAVSQNLTIDSCDANTITITGPNLSGYALTSSLGSAAYCGIGSIANGCTCLVTSDSIFDALALKSDTTHDHAEYNSCAEGHVQTTVQSNSANWDNTYSTVNACSSDWIKLTSLSTGSENTASGNGAISYNNTNGVFTYTPPVHDSLCGFVGNEHINHTSVSISTSTGLSGGGDISTTRTLALSGQARTLHDLTLGSCKLIGTNGSGVISTINQNTFALAGHTHTTYDSCAEGHVQTTVQSNSGDWEVNNYLSAGSFNNCNVNLTLGRHDLSNIVVCLNGYNYNCLSNTPTIPAAANNATITLSAGEGLKNGGNFTTNQSNNATINFNLCLNELTTSTNNDDGDYFVVVDNAGNQRKLSKSNINISEFNNNSNFNNYSLLVQELTSSNTSAKITLRDGNDTDSDIVITGGTNITVTYNSASQLTINGPDLSGYALTSHDHAEYNSCAEGHVQTTVQSKSGDWDVNNYLSAGSFNNSNVNLTLGRHDLSNIVVNLSGYNYDCLINKPTIPAATNNATITLSAGEGLTSGGNFTTNQSNNATINFNLCLNELTTSTNNDNGDYFVVVDNVGNQRKLSKGNINISEFNNDSNFDNYTGWKLYTDTTDRGIITSQEQVSFCGGNCITLGYTATNNVITINHTDTSSATSSVNSGRIYIQSLTLDDYGHVTGISTSTENDVLVDGDFTSQGIMLRGASTGSYSILTNNSANWNNTYTTVNTNSASWDDNNYLSAGSFNSSNVNLTLGRRDLSNIVVCLNGYNYNCLSNKPTIPTNNNQLTNGCNYITSYTDTNYYLDGITQVGNTLTFSVNGTTNQSFTFGSNAFNSTTIPTNNNQLTNGAGYTTCTGDITNVSAGTGLSGGGDSGSVTLSLANTTVTAGTYTNSNITVDAQGRITSASSGSSGGTVYNSTITFDYGACIEGYANPDSFDLNQSANESFCFAHSTGGAGSGNYSGGINSISLDSYGHVTSVTTGCSDYRVKTNVQPYTIGYEAVKCVDTYQYILIDDEDKKCHAGMMAHELQEAGIFHGPYGVKDEVNEEGEPVYQTVNYSELVPTLWSALKTAIKKIETLESKLERLELQFNG